MYYTGGKDKRRKKVVISFEELTPIFKLYHGSPTGGHSGWNATLEKISRMYHWRKMAEDIRHYVSNVRGAVLCLTHHTCITSIVDTLMQIAEVKHIQILYLIHRLKIEDFC